jgi:hypothetical protein
VVPASAPASFKIDGAGQSATTWTSVDRDGAFVIKSGTVSALLRAVNCRRVD